MNVTLWLLWVVANTIGGAVAGAAVNALGLAGLAVFGVPIGLAQYLAIRRYWRVRWTWVLATAIGAFVGWVMIYLTFPILDQLCLIVLSTVLPWLWVPLAVRNTAAWVLAGCAAGTASGLIIGRTQKVPTGLPSSRASPGTLWERLSVVAGLAAFGIAGATLAWRAFFADGSIMPVTPAVVELLPNVRGAAVFVVIAGPAFGAIYGAITGIALARLQRRAGAYAR